MKRKIKQIGIIVIVAVIGFSLATCNNGGNSGDGSSSGGNNNNNDNNSNNGNNGNNNNTNASGYSISGDNLTLSGQVYKLDVDDESGEVITTKCNDSFDVYAGWSFEVIGTVNNGQLNVKMGKPDINKMMPITDFFITDFFDVVPATGVNFYMLESLSSGYDEVFYGNFSEYIDIDNHNIEGVLFFFVDINANIRTEGYSAYGDETSACNLSLKAGWNTVTIKVIRYERHTTKTTYSQTVPSGLKWIHME